MQPINPAAHSYVRKGLGATPGEGKTWKNKKKKKKKPHDNKKTNTHKKIQQWET